MFVGNKNNTKLEKNQHEVLQLSVLWLTIVRQLVYSSNNIV